MSNLVKDLTIRADQKEEAHLNLIDLTNLLGPIEAIERRRKVKFSQKRRRNSQYSIEITH